MIEPSALLAAVGGLIGVALVAPPEVALAGGVGVALAPWLREPARRAPWAPVTVAVLVAAFALSPTPIAGGAISLVYLLVHRRLTRAGPGDDQVTALLCGLMLVAAVGRVDAPGFLLAVLAWVGGAVGLLIGASAPSGGRRRALVARRLVGAAALVIGLSAALFVALPRLRDAGTDGAASLTGFEREVDLDDVVALLDDPTVVAWVLAQSVGGGQVEGPLYLRGLALDSFDGRRWSASSPPSPVDPPSAPIPAEAIVVEVLREPLVGGVMPVPGQVAILRAPGTELSVDEGGAWYGGKGRQLRYALVAGPPLRPEERGAAGTWPPSALGLPALDARVVEIAAALDGQTPAELAAAAVERVGQQGYARRVVPRAGDDPLAAFLAEGAEGHCELFASSVAVLLRARGVPARVINGFAVGRVGEPLPSGVFPMRRSHAHAWVEAWIDGAWVLLDATPPGGEGPAVAWSPPTVVDRAAGWWRSSVVGYDHRVQVDAARTVARWVGATLPVVGRDAVSAERIGLVLLGLSALAALGLAVALARRLLRRLDGGRPANPGGAVAHAHARARAHLARQGVHPPLCLPPVAAAEWVAARGDPRGEDLVALAWLHYRVRYGGEPDAALLPAARELVARLTG